MHGRRLDFVESLTTLNELARKGCLERRLERGLGGFMRLVRAESRSFTLSRVR
jgi:hypothetical protein